MKNLTRSQKKDLFRIILSAALFAIAALLPLTGWARFAAFLVPYLIIGGETLEKAARNIIHGQIFDENFLMAIATVGALAIGEYPEAVFVMLFYEIGELFEHIAVGKSRSSISALMDIRPDCANVERDGEIVQTDPDEVEVGTVIVVRPGERIPIDGVVIDGASSINTAALTGESVPRDVSVGDAVISGCVNISGLLRVKTEKPFGESTVSRILELVENSSENKAKSENFISHFAKWYTPAVVAGAVLLAIVPPLFDGQFIKWIRQALVFLVISCPCALLISVPLTFFGGIGGASKRGILVKGANYLETLSKVSTVIMDKTGTLTEGSFRVAGVYPENVPESELLELAALAESFSSHPIARSVCEACGVSPDKSRIGAVEEVPGRGVSAVIDGKAVLIGGGKLMAEHGIEIKEAPRAGKAVHMACGGEYAGCIVISDKIKETAAETVSALRSRGIKTVMLTGDKRETGESVAKELGIDSVYAELLPDGKVDAAEKIMEENRDRGAVMFVGDGINDAPVLARADIGVAMGALGSDAAIEAADVVLMDDDPAKIVRAIEISRRTGKIVRENIVFALAVKAVILALGIAGMANMWQASFADVGVMVIAVLNAMRALKA